MEVITIPTYKEGGLNEFIHPKFGRCNSFTFITLEKNEITQVKVIKNSAADESHGSGTLAAKIVHKNGGEKLIVSKLGSNASKALESLYIKIYQAPEKKLLVRELLSLYKKGEIKLTLPEDILSKELD